jgi:hypothetical protein
MTHMMMKPRVNPRSSAAAELTKLQRTVPAAQPAVLKQAQTMGTLLSQSAARKAGNYSATAAMAPLMAHADTWKELFAFQSAIGERVQQWQHGWLQGWNAWMEEVADLKRANTLSEQVEQHFNLAAQIGVLIKKQTADLLTLQENIEVNYGYWVAQKVKRPSS